MKAPSLTLGIEEEYQIIDPETRELRSYITEILDHDHLILVSTQGHARRFEMTQIRPTIEGPTPTKLDWTLPGWPRARLPSCCA